MAESPKSEASHESSPAAGKLQLTKDRECPYCHQAFTSSSLGRHLDQYIFRKKPDGIHKVDEIRQLRGAITRRTNKGGSATKQDREEGSGTPLGLAQVGRDSPMTTEIRADLNATPPEGYKVFINAPNWQSTGVINELPTLNTLDSSTPNGPTSRLGVDAAAAREILGLRNDLGSEKETARALELALREVLDTIQAARSTTNPLPSPFPIDISAHTFPSLVLQLLPTPSTLLTSIASFPTPTSFPLNSPPNQTHLNLLLNTSIDLVKAWQTSLLPSSRDIPSHYPTEQSYVSHLNSLADSHTRAALDHINLAYSHYASLPHQQQSEIWQIELARAYASEQQKRKEAEGRLESVMAEARQLSRQIDMLSKCQWPREMALWPPQRRSVGKAILREMDHNRPENRGIKRAADGSIISTIEFGAGHRMNGTEDEEDDEASPWSFEPLLNKWKNIVREDKVRKRGLIQPTTSTLSSTPVPPTPDPPPINTNTTPNTSRPPSTNTTRSTTKPSQPQPQILIPIPPALSPIGPTIHTPTSINTLLTSTLPLASSSSTSANPAPQPKGPFEPWSKRPKFYNNEAGMIGIPISNGADGRAVNGERDGRGVGKSEAGREGGRERDRGTERDGGGRLINGSRV